MSPCFIRKAWQLHHHIPLHFTSDLVLYSSLQNWYRKDKEKKPSTIPFPRRNNCKCFLSMISAKNQPWIQEQHKKKPREVFAHPHLVLLPSKCILLTSKYTGKIPKNFMHMYKSMPIWGCLFSRTLMPHFLFSNLSHTPFFQVLFAFVFVQGLIAKML